MTYGEQSELAYSFLEKLRKSDNPEEDLRRERIISTFIETLSPKNKQEFNSDYEKLRRDERFKDQKSFQSFENYIYEDVLELHSDVKSEYLSLKKQVDDLFALISSRQQYLNSKLTMISDKKSLEYKKLQDLRQQTEKIEKKAREQSSTGYLIELATSNSQSASMNWMMFGRQDFSRLKWQIHFQDLDIRKFINFGLLPVSQTDELVSLKISDHSKYLACFKQIIQEYEIVDSIIRAVNTNPLMKDRYHIVEEALAFFQKADYQLFAHIIVPQIEGFFRLYMEAMHIHKRAQSIGDVVKEIYEKDSFFEYLYFKYDFPGIRNPIAHGDVMNPTTEQAYEILMDLHWIVDKFDSDDRDYKKWMSWLEKFSKCTDEHERRLETLDYFNNGLEKETRLDNLKLFLSHQYSRWIEIYGLSEAGKELLCTLSSKELYGTIWTENMPLEVEETESINGKDCKVRRQNSKPLEYEDFVELMHNHRLCPDDWYADYRGFAKKQEEWFYKALSVQEIKNSASMSISSKRAQQRTTSSF